MRGSNRYCVSPIVRETSGRGRKGKAGNVRDAGQEGAGSGILKVREVGD